MHGHDGQDQEVLEPILGTVERLMLLVHHLDEADHLQSPLL
jgi:hypothetical protein